MTALLVGAVAVSYLVGSVPSAVLVGRAHGVDPRTVGDRNPGYWNVKETLGRRAAVPVFVLDTAKGTVAAALGLLVADVWWGGYLCLGAAMIGHAWPVFAGFAGGRSVLAFVGGVPVLAPWPALVAFTLFLAVWVVTRSFAYGARVGVFGFPVLQAFLEPLTHVAATGALMSLIGLRFGMAWWEERRRQDPPGPGTSGPATSGPDAPSPS